MCHVTASTVALGRRPEGHALPVVRLGVLVVTVLGATSAHAGSVEDQLAELVHQQAAQISVLEARVKALENQLIAASRSAESPAASLAPPSVTAAAALPQSANALGEGSGSPIIKWKGAPEISSSDGRVLAKLRGRVLSDFWATSSNVEGVDYPSGTEIRSVSLGIEGRLNQVIAYRMEVDFANERTVLRDTWLQLKGAGPSALMIGNLKPLFSLEHLSGFLVAPFLESALPNVFALTEAVGLRVETHRANWYSGVSAFGEPAGTALDGDEGYGVALRLGFAPVLEQERFVHLGASGYRKLLQADAGHDFHLRARPEVRVFETPLADTGSLNAVATQAFGLELAAAAGPFSLQAEYMQNRIDYTTGKATFDGGYLLGSWLVTGESRPYSISSSTIGRLKPKHPVGDGGWGAFELAVRYSILDLNDNGVFGGEEYNVAVGANWYLSDFARLMLDFVHYELHGNTAVRPFGSAAHNGDALGLRAQVDW